ncbi:DUF455 domain-containing protein [Poronia punctata]|nr:DUF455 domain-containing protein [Poronia punctata]
MATEEATPRTNIIALDSYDTALCIIPPKHLWPRYDSLRFLYDKAYEKWPPHINLVYPFVRVESLKSAVSLLESKLADASLAPFDVSLDGVDVFAHKHDNTIVLCDSDKRRASRIQELRKTITTALGHTSTSNYRMHLTVGQSQDIDAAPHKFLLDKAASLPATEWSVDRIYVLIRERMQIDGSAFSQMKIWGTIDLTNFSVSRADPPEHFNESKHVLSTTTHTPEITKDGESQVNYPYTFSAKGRWVSHQPTSAQAAPESESEPDSLTLASYNVLAEFEHPPSDARYPLILKNILQESILADVLVLEEVTDHFLSFICRDEDIRKHYRYISHGPPYQDDIPPLPSHLNVVVLSRWSFSWKWLPFNRNHKGSMIVEFTDIGKRAGDVFFPTILATVHLTHGLTDGAVTAKKLELQTLLTHLSQQYDPNPWILAGDFNITTSTQTIEAALKKRAISPQTVTYLKGIENTLAGAGLVDAWAFSRVQFGDPEQDFGRESEIFEGEQGATFDPMVNDLAAEIVGSRFSNRPQRYDRILLKGEGTHAVTGFNLFGRRQGYLQDTTPRLSYASDHWGVRCSMSIQKAGDSPVSEAISNLSVPVHIHPASRSLDNVSDLRECLQSSGIFPSAEEAAKRKEAFVLLKNVVLDENNPAARGQPIFVLTPVGSYGLGVWTTSSDIDCLCIGPISSRTFLAIATRRIRRAENRGVQLRRRVNAHSGMMLELEVLGIKMDLHYCSSSIIAETWPYAMRLPASDAVFSLPAQTLSKLKPARDMSYIRSTVPDYAVFKTAYYLIRQWAKQRGIYAAKFGLLSGIQISILLSLVCKLVSHRGEPVSLSSVLATFFNHYAGFDWSTQMAFDPFFHKQLRYVRTAREPMVILGFHPPALNTAMNASLNSVRTIDHEFKKANTLLSQDGMTWSEFMSADRGYDDFLSAFKTFVRIDVHFWGVSLAKGSGFVGWLESRCVMLLVDLNRRIPNLHARIWPTRFVDQELSENESDYQGYYLIGLDVLDDSISKDDRKNTLGSLHTVLQDFERRIRGDGKYFDSNTSWMSASLVNKSDLGTLRADDREWGDYPVGDDLSDDDDEEEDDEEEDEQLYDDEEGTTKKSKSKTKELLVPTRPSYTGKFRSSADVINRIRWDPNMDSGDYMVGYEDRFLGVMERALDAWKAEQTDEEFIPQHRILYFKRKSDGMIVWDRKERRDIVFGSGVSTVPWGPLANT